MQSKLLLYSPNLNQVSLHLALFQLMYHFYLFLTIYTMDSCLYHLLFKHLISIDISNAFFLQLEVFCILKFLLNILHIQYNLCESCLKMNLELLCSSHIYSTLYCSCSLEFLFIYLCFPWKKLLLYLVSLIHFMYLRMDCLNLFWMFALIHQCLYWFRRFLVLLYPEFLLMVTI
jgi:hypothetical protein